MRRIAPPPLRYVSCGLAVLLLGLVTIQPNQPGATQVPQTTSSGTGSGAAARPNVLSPATTGDAPSDNARDPGWAQADALAVDGVYDDAEEAYAAIGWQTSGAEAAQAWLAEARTALTAKDTDTANRALERILNDVRGTPPDALRASAFYLQGNARQMEGDCTNAVLSWAAVDATDGSLGPYPSLARAACYAQLSDWAHERDAAQQALSTEDGGPRLAQIDAHEKVAEADVHLGDSAAALNEENALIDLAGTRSYRAEALYQSGQLARAVGDESLAQSRFLEVVLNYADQPRAAAALDALDTKNEDGGVSDYQAAKVRLAAQQTTRAVSLLANVPSDSSDAGPAAFDRALLGVGNGASQDAIQTLLDLSTSDPPDAAAPLLQAARTLENQGAYAAADTLYTQVAQVAPSGADQAAALTRSGVTRYARGDTAGALQAWQAAVVPARQATPRVAAEAWFWLGKLLAATHGLAATDTRAALTQAASAAPQTYFGARAKDLLDGVTDPQMGSPDAGAAALANAQASDRDRAAWLAQMQITPDQALADVEAEPGMERAGLLLSLGQATDASWEIESVVRAYVQNGDVVHLNALVSWLTAWDAQNLALSTAQQEEVASRSGDSLPSPVLRQLYPAAWGDVAAAKASRAGVDPLLLLAVTRQESSFDPQARSAAGALGLTQVMPSTGSQVARALGIGTFQPTDLLKPEISFQFGAAYLAAQVAHYNGHVLPLLAAYNAGSGSVDQWLQTWGSDPDLFAEEIPYAETRTYVQVVYTSYRWYRDLYGG